MSLADTIASALTAITPTILSTFPDLCDLKQPGTLSPDGFGGTTDTPATVEASLECFYERLSERDKVLGGTLITTQTHKMMIKATASTRLIQPHQWLVVAARELPALTFRKPVTLDGSYAPVITIAAELVKS